MAGMAIWFPCVNYKMAAWIHFPNITLGGGHCLTLGTCDVKAKETGIVGKRAQKVAFVAGRDSQIWKTNVMFGALPTPCLHLTLGTVHMSCPFVSLVIFCYIELY